MRLNKNRWGAEIAWHLGLAAMYFGAVRLGVAFTMQPEGLASIWPASGVALAALLLRAPRRWPYALAVILVVNAAGNLSGGAAWPVSLGFAAANTLEPLACAWAMRRLAGTRISFTRLSEVLALAGVAVAGVGLSALLGAVVPALAYGAPYWSAWAVWWVADGLGIMLAAPLIITWARKLHSGRWPRWPRLMEGAALIGAMTAVAGLILAPSTAANRPLLFAALLLPFVISAAVRFPQHGVTTILAWLAALVLWNTVRGHAGLGFVHEDGGLVVEQLFLGIHAGVALIISAMFSERKQVEKSLRRSEGQFRTLVQSLPDIVYTLDPDQRHTSIFGLPADRPDLTPEFFLGRTARDIFGAEQAAGHEAANARALAGELFVYEWSAPGAAGELHYQTSLSPLRDAAGRVTGLVGVARDISARKQAEETVRAKTEELDRYFNSSLDLLCIADLDGYFRRLNPEWERTLGYSLADLEGKRFLDLVHPDDLPATLRAIARLGGQESVLNFENRYRHQDGSCRWIEWRASAAGQLIYAAARDVTDRKQAEAALATSEAKFRSLFENMQEGFALHEIITDENGRAIDFRFLEANAAYERHTGQKRQDCLGRTIREIMPQVDRRQIEGYGRVAATGEPLTLEYHSHAFKRDFRVRAFCPQPGRFAAIFEDITERQQAEEQLKHLTNELQVTLSTITAGISHIKDRQVEWANAAHDEMFGYAPGESRGQATAIFYPDQEKFERLGREAYPQLLAGKTYLDEMQMRKKDGTLFWCSLTGRAVKPGQPAEGAIWMLQDISERRRADEALRAALAEKEVLIKEIHHRVKNNLQVMVSLLNMQAERITDPPSLAIFHDSRERVRTMALVHEQLYQSPDLARIQFGDYLRELTHNLQHIYGAPAGIRVRVRAQEVWLGVDTAIPCGLLANELISNAFKYAFPGRPDGQIDIGLEQLSEPAAGGGRRFRLTVADDGVGFPPDFDPAAAESLGLHLVQILTRQLNGSLTIQPAPGVRFEILFQERRERRA